MREGGGGGLMAKKFKEMYEGIRISRGERDGTTQ